MTTFRNSASYGKRQEYIAVAELLKRDFDVYMTLVDDQGIDCVIRVNDKRYLDVQIKSRSIEAIKKNWAFFDAGIVPPNRDNYYYIFFSEGLNKTWVLPSQDIIELSNVRSSVTVMKSGKNVGKYRIQFAGYSKVNDECIEKLMFQKYEGDSGFKLLQ